MESLKFYLKEQRPFLIFYGIIFSLSVILFVDSGYRYKMGVFDITMFKFWVRSVLFIPALFFYKKDLKEFSLVYKDYKTQITETKILYVRNLSCIRCKDEFNGAYAVYYCSEKQNQKCSEYWLYRKDLLYDETIHGDYYKVTYYKNSRCLYSIEPISPNSDNDSNNTSQSKIKKKQKSNKGISSAKSNLGKTKHRNESNQDLQDNKSAKIVTDTVSTIGIPMRKKTSNAQKQGFYLFVKNDGGKKIRLFFRSTDILGLGDLSERPGYMGYGDFIGTIYEVEYYKFSREVKSMKIISVQLGDSSVSYDEIS